MTTLATLDGLLRNNEQATADAIELCAYTVEHNNRNPHAYHTVRHAPDDARKLLSYIESDDDERTTEDARDELDSLMHDVESAMYELGFLAYWEDSIFRIETINDEKE